MDVLKKIFPCSFKYTKSIGNLIVGIIVQALLAILAGFGIGLATLLTGWLPIVGPILAWALGVVSGLIGFYVLVGIVIQVLVFLNIIKD